MGCLMSLRMQLDDNEKVARLFSVLASASFIVTLYQMFALGLMSFKVSCFIVVTFFLLLACIKVDSYLNK